VILVKPRQQEKLPLTATGTLCQLQSRQQFFEVRVANQQVGLVGVATVTRLKVPDQLGPNAAGWITTSEKRRQPSSSISKPPQLLG
jgi:hypothetical protein